MSYIKCGDSKVLLKEIPDSSVDLVVTDPPYAIGNQGGGLYTQSDKQYVQDLGDIKDGFSIEILDELCRVMKKINIYIWCSQKQIIWLLNYFVTVKKCNWNLITWHKSNPIPACGNKYLTDTEYCLFFREPGVKVGGSFDSKKTYYVTPLNVKDKKEFGHPTIKPLDIIENLVINSSEPGDTVLDCFMGSGTTCLAAKNLNREYIGFEIAPDYFEIAKQRIGDISSDSSSNTDFNLSHSNALHKATACTQNRLF